MVDSFPDEILVHIFRNLRWSERVSLELVCKKWKRLLVSTWQDANELKILGNSLHISNSVTHKEETLIKTNQQVFQAIASRCGGGRIDHICLKGCGNSVTENVISGHLFDMIQTSYTLKTIEFSDCVFPWNFFVEYKDKLRQIVAMPTLKCLIFKDNIAEELCDVGNTRRIIDPSVLTSISTSISQLHLEGVSLPSRGLHFLCQRLAGTLEKFCYKVTNLSIPQFPTESFQLLTKLKDLNIGGKRPLSKPLSSFLRNKDFMRLVDAMPNIESVNIRSAGNITDEAVAYLIEKASQLKSVNLNCCWNISPMLIEFLCDASDATAEMEGFGWTPLTIYNYKPGLVEIQHEWWDRIPDWLTIVNEVGEQDESIFWGESKTVSLEEGVSGDEDEETFEGVAVYESDTSSDGEMFDLLPTVKYESD